MVLLVLVGLAAPPAISRAAWTQESAPASGSGNASDAPWRALPPFEPEGEVAHTGAHVLADRSTSQWQRPPVIDRPAVTTGRKTAKVVVLIYDPVLESEGGVRLTEHCGANDPVQLSHILAHVIRESSWGYVNYEIVDWITVDGYPVKVDGFRYDDDSFLEVRRTQQWQPATISYRALFEENGLLPRFQDEGITELWLWGANGMHFDEFAFHVPNRYARFGPTDNPWLYRPYDIPPELDRTTWVMGFNYEVGADNMIHSYTHRIESIAALQFGDGVWDTKAADDPWNVFTVLELDFPGRPSQVGNCHVPPNGERGYDYDNRRTVLSHADRWARYPDLRGEPREINAADWGFNQFGYQRWILDHLPKFPGATPYGYNNWWVYIANTDEELPDYEAPVRDRFVAPMPASASGGPPPARK